MAFYSSGLIAPLVIYLLARGFHTHSPHGVIAVSESRLVSWKLTLAKTDHATGYS